MKKRIGIQGALILLAIWVIILLPKLAFPQRGNEFIGRVIDAAGVLLILFGFLFRISARGYKEQECDNGKRLVMTGPYSLIRNPMYFGTLMVCSGIILVILDLWLLPVFLAVYLIIYIPQIKREEKVLSDRFGDEYQNYCEATPIYFPNFLRLIRPKGYIVLKPAWIKKEVVSMTLALLTVFIIHGWAYAKVFGARSALIELIELLLVIGVFFAAVYFMFIKRKI